MGKEIKPLLAVIFFSVLFLFIFFKAIGVFKKEEKQNPMQLEVEKYITNDSLMQLNEKRAAMPLP
jgi:hypothetical protein